MTLDAQLATLETAALIRRVLAEPESEYSFRHELIRDTVYRTALRAEQRSLHRRVGEALECLYPEQIEELAAILARHFDLGGELPRAFHYFTRAGDAALRQYATVEAVEQYGRALQLASAVQPERGELQALYLKYGRALELSGKFREAVENYASMERLGQERGDRALELAALAARGPIHATTVTVQDHALSIALSERALVLAQELGDLPTETKVLWNLSLVHSWNGRPREAVAYGEQAIALARELGLKEQLAFALNDISFGYLGMGEMERAAAVLEEARALWRELGNVPMLADSLARSSVMPWLTADYATAERLAHETIEVSRSIDHAWGQAEGYWRLAVLAVESGELDAAQAAIEEAVRWGEPAGHMGALVGVLILRVWLDLIGGAVAEGIARGQETLAKTREVFSGWRAWALAILARLYVAQGDLERAEALAREARGATAPGDFITFIPVMLADGEVGLARGEVERALERVKQAEAYFKQSHTRYLHADVLYLQARAFAQARQMPQAEDVLQEASDEACRHGTRRLLNEMERAERN